MVERKYKHAYELTPLPTKQTRSKSFGTTPEADATPNLYTPLPSDTSTRLVVLHPGRYGDDIHCSLRVVDLNDWPLYVAVSHTWGCAGVNTYLTLHGSDDTHARVTIRENMDSCLRRLRHSDVERVLWIDALSIEQDDLAEKTNQVAIIGLIFKMATGVVAWVGEHSDSSEAFFRPNWEDNIFLGRIARFRIFARRCTKTAKALVGILILTMTIIISLVCLVTTLRTSWGHLWDPSIILPGLLALSGPWVIALLMVARLPLHPPTSSELARESSAWRAFITRPYWQRVWVVQEIALARALIIQCGPDQVEWDSFMSQFRWNDSWGYTSYGLECLVSDRDHTHSAPSDDPYWYMEFLDLARRPHEGFNMIQQFVRLTADRKCFDRRDRIYALLSMEDRDAHPVPIVPDYTVDFLEMMRMLIMERPDICHGCLAYGLQLTAWEKLALSPHFKVERPDEEPFDFGLWIEEAFN